MKDVSAPKESRRAFLVKSGIFLAAASLSGAGCGRGSEKEAPAFRLPPTEDLMREHGVLRRLLLVYDEIGRRLDQGVEFQVQVLTEANHIIRRFIQDYHEVNEQTHVFKRFADAGKMVKLVAILYQQHIAGRKLIDEVDLLIAEDNLKNPAKRQKVTELLKTFSLLCRHHAASEDTTLFPSFRAVISPQDFTALGETFDKEEEKLFGASGFEKIVGQVAEFEKNLGIYDLQQFIPKL